jgi:hypothetical protein
VCEHDVGDLGQHRQLFHRQQVDNMLADGTDIPKFATVEEYFASLPETLRPIAERLLPIVDGELPGAGAWHGHATWSLGEAPDKSPVRLVKGYPSYLTFSFWKGEAIDDPSGRLEAGAQQMAGLALRSVDDLDAELFTCWLRQARSLETTA